MAGPVAGEGAAVGRVLLLLCCVEILSLGRLFVGPLQALQGGFDVRLDV